MVYLNSQENLTNEINSKDPKPMESFETNDKAKILNYDIKEMEIEEKSFEIKSNAKMCFHKNAQIKYTRRLLQLEYASIVFTTMSFITFAILAYEGKLNNFK